MTSTQVLACTHAQSSISPAEVIGTWQISTTWVYILYQKVSVSPIYKCIWSMSRNQQLLPSITTAHA